MTNVVNREDEEGSLSELPDRARQLNPEPAPSAAAEAEVVAQRDDLVDQIKEAMVARTPTSSFRHGLKRELMDLARDRPDREVLVATPAARRELIIGAAIGSAVALAGGIVYLLRIREQGRARTVGRAQMEHVPTGVR